MPRNLRSGSEEANALAETALVASEAREQLTAPIGGGLGGWATPAADGRQAAKPSA